MTLEAKVPGREPISIWLRILGVVGFVFGLSLALPGLYLIFLGGSWFYAVAGTATMAAGWDIFRGRARGIRIYLGICLGTLIWSLWDVRDLDVWFWPLIPRLFAFAFALFFVLLAAPLMTAYRGRAGIRRMFRVGALVVLAGLGITVWQMFLPHGMIRHDFAATEGTRVTQAALDMGDEWHNYGRTTSGTRFTPADQITAENVDKLEVAWTYQTGQYADGANSDQNTPSYADGSVYACTPFNQVHAIDAVTGKQKWMFDSQAYVPFGARCRGVTYYEIPQATGVCAKRIAMTTIGARLISLDAETGKPCEDFGEKGVVNMGEGIGHFNPSVYMPTSAPTVSHGKIISGANIVDNFKVGEPSGVVRAWDAQTGKLAWAWDIGRPGQTGPLAEGETYTPFTPNVWSHMSVDEERGLIFLPTGNATPDVWLSHRRPFDHEYTDAIVALDINTGLEKWHFQTTHKDVWDYDLPSQPTLYDLPDPKTGATIPVLIQTTKRGEIFMLNRETGEPVADVVEKPVRIDDAVPEMTGMSPTQPYSVGMPTIGAAPLTEASMWGATPIDQLSCRIKFRQLRYSGDEFTAPTTEPAIGFPSALGGMNWGSVSVDEKDGIMIVNDIRFPMIVQLVPRKDVPNKAWPKDGHQAIAPQLGTPYGIERHPMTSNLGLLCLHPPYGTLSGIDLNTRKLVWQRPVGTIESLDAAGLQTGLKMPIGMPTLGGSLTTGSGLVFFDNAMDHYLRVFDSKTGDLLREIPIPVGATATPMSYVAPDGRQYVVISVGGSSGAVTDYRGDYVIAYALPQGD